MKPVQEKYPFFEANQVLTNAHLNLAIDYLDEQERLTRANLIGIGIVCGLETSVNVAQDTVSLGKGCGITGEGYLIVEPKNVDLVSYRKYNLPAELAYPTFKDIDLWELFPLTGAGTVEPDTTKLSDDPSVLKDAAIVVFLELKKDSLRNCSVNNCDDKGAVVTATVRRLLVNVANLNANPQPALPEVPLPRLGFATPERLRDFEQVYKDFLTTPVAGKTVVERLSNAVNQAYQLLKILLPSLDNTPFKQLPAALVFPNPSSQYYYDLLRDLTAAYHELRWVLSQQLAVCLPDSSLFPRHLVLGTTDNVNTKLYRTVFSASPAAALPQQKLGELGFLFERLNQMVKNFHIQADVNIPIKITPSLFGLKQLSGKSLPFYYNAGLRQYWDSGRKAEPQTHEILSWHDDVSSPDHVRNPLQYDLEAFNFFRVEGHVGKNVLNVVMQKLGDLIKDNRLPISVLYVNADAVGSFLEKHFAIEHQAGVMPGGTLVVLYRGVGANINTVLGDFALPYRIEKTDSSNCVCRVQVKECEYEWFDTKQHLANLAKRAYRFPPRQVNSEPKAVELEKVLLAEFYVIVIYRYEIQGQSLLVNNSPMQVKIPIAELISGQLSAIARGLNEKFSNGVVFDYNKNTNKLVIRYFADQTFRIEWGGLQGNQIRYAYTPADISRWQKKKWETLTNPSYKVVCHLRDEYHADEYQWLHENNHYEAIYPTPKPMPTANELKAWEELIVARSKLAIPIQPILSAISTFIGNQYNVGNPTVDAVLVGSWANGSWMSSISSQNNFPSGFLTLREEVTGKTRPSDIELLIDIIPTSQITVAQVLQAINEDERIQGTIRQNGGYKINVFSGKKDAQKNRG
jgi:hypothetical protein